MGTRRCVEATSALTVRRPSVGGVSMMMYWYCLTIGLRRSLSLKWPSNSPIILPSNLARVMRAGMMSRVGMAVWWIASFTESPGSVRASYTVVPSWVGSMKDSVQFAWGSRSMRRVLNFFWARAAARLIAVVVLPTPPFWLAMARIIRGSFHYATAESV